MRENKVLRLVVNYIQNKSLIMKKFMCFLILLALLLNYHSSFAQDRCTTTFIYHNYVSNEFDHSLDRIRYHTMLHCNFELDLDRPNQFFEAEMDP